MTRPAPGRAAALLTVLCAVLCGTPAPAQRGEPIPQQLTFAPHHAEGIYAVGETVGWTVTPGPVPPTSRFRWTARRNNAVILKQAVLDLSHGSDTIEIEAREPGMIYVAIEAFEDDTQAPADTRRFVGGNAGRNDGFYAVGAAVAPHDIGVSTPRPADFDTFWRGKLEAQTSVPINPVLAPAQTDIDGVDLQMFQLDALGSRAHGWIAKPARP